jgi:enediyne biosynthesis protein E4
MRAWNPLLLCMTHGEISDGHAVRRALAAAALAVVASLLLLDGRLMSSASHVQFREVAAGAGLTFTHDNGASPEYHLPEIMGSGVALFDYDGDGDLDIFLVQGAPIDGGRGSDAGVPRTSRLFRNDLTVDAGGRPSLRFTDVTREAGVGHFGVGMGVALGDYDGDGWLDLYVTSYGSNALYRNNGDGTFTDVTSAANADDARWSTSAAFIDYDRDGYLDLFIVNYVDFTAEARKVCTDPAGARDYCSPSAYRPVPDRLLRNQGDGTFADVTESAGVSRAYGAGLGVTVGDYNGDGWLDLYVANDATPNQLWINRQDGSFEDQGWLSGAAVNAAGRPEGSMGIASGDYDGDGHEDLFITNLSGETHVLYVNDGRANFDDRRAAAGIAQPTALMTGFGTAWLDVDRDGLPDLVVANGAVNIIAALRGTPAPYHQRNQVFQNIGDGRLREVTGSAGPAFELSEVSRGLAVGDLDNDGSMDVVVTNNGGPVRLMLNTTPGGHWLTVRLSADSGNRWGFGARVGVVRRGYPTIWRRIGSDGSYLSASDPRAHFGLGTAPEVERLVVEWPDGSHESWTDVRADRQVTLERGTGSPQGTR